MYKTSGGSPPCIDASSNGALATGDYAAYAIWLANFAKSVQQQGANLYALSLQNEPEMCDDGTYWSPSTIDEFVSQNFGPTFASQGISTLIFVPESLAYSDLTNMGGVCATDSSCSQYVGGFNWHDYDASLSGTNTVTPDPYPSGWPGGKRYWETEVECSSGVGLNICGSDQTGDITNGLDFGAVIDQRIAVDNANAWLYWTMDGDLDNSGAIPQRAYVIGQYSKFVRPGYYRIDATHLPSSQVSVSAYQNTSTNTLVLIATNYSTSPVSQTFNIQNAPTFTSMTPTITSASLSLAAQSNVSVSGNSFTYTLPAQSITTFVATAGGPQPPSNLSGTVVQ
jgi:glucuronoarabinoxylan endo-1,4-beta-xylanase